MKLSRGTYDDAGYAQASNVICTIGWLLLVELALIVAAMAVISHVSKVVGQ